MKYLFFLLPLFAIFLFTPSSASAVCSGVPAGGNYTVTSSCTMSGEGGVGGVDNGNLTIDAGFTLTINANERVAWNSGFSITVNGTISKAASGAVLQKTNLWVVDDDDDGYAGSLTYVAQNGSPGATYARRNLVANYLTLDVNDTNASCYRNRYATTGGTITSCIADTTCVADEAGYQDTPAAFFTVFVTSTSSDGNLTNVGTLDANCDTLAGASGSVAYTAWASESTSLEPGDRGLSACVTAGSGSVPWRLTDGSTVVANNWADLVDGSLQAAISRNESNASDCGADVWTGTNADGTDDTADCTSWTSNASNKSGRTGVCSATDGTWSDKGGGALKCNNSVRKSYCFQHED